MKTNSTRFPECTRVATAVLISPLLFWIAANGNAENLNATHASLEPKDCLESGCHAGIADRQTLDPDIDDAHVVMLAEAPGKEKWQCAWCHRAPDLSEDLKQAAGWPQDETAHLRKRVDVKLCVLCHGRDPAPGMPLARHKPFYQLTFAELDPPPDGEELYDLLCSGCHRPLQISKVGGESGSDIREAINDDKGGMRPLNVLTLRQVADIANALAQVGDGDD